MRLTIIPVEDFPKEVKQPPTDDLIEVYKTCLLLRDVCWRRKLGGLNAIQVGIPWALFVMAFWPGIAEKDWHFFLNPSYEPLSDEKQDARVRFPNVEDRNSRYFLVKRYKDIKYQVTELVVDGQPKLVEKTGTDNEFGIFVQHECQLLAGKYPHQEGEEYWFRNGVLTPK